MIGQMIEQKFIEALTGKDIQGKKIEKSFSQRWEEYINLMRKFETN